MMRLFTITIFVVLVGGLMTKPVAAQEVTPLDATATAKIKSEVSDAVASYLKVFNAHDPKGVAENAQAAPSFVVLPSFGILPYLHTEDVAKFSGDAMTQMKGAGWDRSKLDIASVCVLAADMALASGNTTRYRTDGTVMNVIGETLLYVRTKEGWRIGGLILHQPNKVVTCNG